MKLELPDRRAAGPWRARRRSHARRRRRPPTERRDDC